jgi:hypothetical protein
VNGYPWFFSFFFLVYFYLFDVGKFILLFYSLVYLQVGEGGMDGEMEGERVRRKMDGWEEMWLIDGY